MEKIAVYYKEKYQRIFFVSYKGGLYLFIPDRAGWIPRSGYISTDTPKHREHWDRVFKQQYRN